MRRTSGWRVAIAGSVVTVMMIVAGCSPWGAPRDERRLREAMIAEVPGVVDAEVRFDADIFTQRVIVNLLMPGTDAEDSAAVAVAVESALEIAWKESPFGPSGVSVSIWLDEFQDGEPPGPWGLNMEDRPEMEDIAGQSMGDYWSAMDSDLLETYGERD